MAENRTPIELEVIRSVAIDICNSESTHQGQLQRTLDYLTEVKAKHGEDYSNQAYNIMWATILTYRETATKNASASLMGEFLKSWLVLPAGVAVVVIAGLVISQITSCMGHGTGSTAASPDQTDTEVKP